MPAPPTVFVNEIDPALAETFNVLLFDIETDPLTAIFAPAPAPLTPEESAVVSKDVLELRLKALPIVIAAAVTILPLRFKVVGADTDKEPRTVNVSVAPSLMLRVPVLLKTRPYELDPDVPITVDAPVPVFNTRLKAVLPVEILAAVIALFNVMVPS